MSDVPNRKVNFFSDMGSLPQGMFAALKVHELKNLENSSNAQQVNYRTFKTDFLYYMESLPLRYSSKLMMSIWNLYNRYSPHNVKQHTDRLTGPEASFHFSVPLAFKI